jgi:hypothetical protein
VANGDPVCPACRKHIAGNEEFCPHCRAALFPLLQAASLFHEGLQKAAQALCERDFALALQWLKASEVWRPNDRRAISLDAVWADYYAQTGDYDRAAQTAARADLTDRARYQALRDAVARAREWASWSLHLTECGAPRSAEYALARSMETGAPKMPLQALLRIVLDFRSRKATARRAARRILRASLPNRFLRWLYREAHPGSDGPEARHQPD